MSELHHIHLVSDATGETLYGIARACLVQFEGVDVKEHHWPMVRTEKALDVVLDGISQTPGLVIYTVIDADIRGRLRERLSELNIRSVSALQPVMLGIRSFLGTGSQDIPGRQHELGEDYFQRMEAMNYAMVHDDGQATRDLSDADIVLVGISRTSKTPTSIYLGNRGYKTANVPLVPGISLPVGIESLSGPLIVGLTTSPDRLEQIRRNRLKSLGQTEETDYVDPDRIKEEVANAHRVYGQNNWPVINVARRSIEETAAAIIKLYEDRAESEAATE